MNKELINFQWKHIRRIRDENKELRYFSVVDIVSALSWRKDWRKYRNKLKQRLNEEKSEVVTNCHQLKLPAEDGKMRLTDVADTQIMFRIIQSIPSPNAEPFKLRLAKVWYERIEETEDPELGINRALQNYINKWYDEGWINQRLKTIDIRKSLTNERKERWILDNQYAILTDEITKARAGITTKQYKKHKWLKKENLRDNMTNLETILNMLAEASTAEISTIEKPTTLDKSKKIAKRWWNIAFETRKNLEKETKKEIISSKNNIDNNEWTIQYINSQEWKQTTKQINKHIDSIIKNEDQYLV